MLRCCPITSFSVIFSLPSNSFVISSNSVAFRVNQCFSSNVTDFDVEKKIIYFCCVHASAPAATRSSFHVKSSSYSS